MNEELRHTLTQLCEQLETSIEDGDFAEDSLALVRQIQVAIGVELEG